MKKTYIFLLLIILLAGSVRFYHLAKEDIWLDEAWSIHYGQQSIYNNIKWTVNDTTPPLYQSVLSVWIDAFGNSTFATRALSAILGILSIPLIFMLGKRMFSTEVGIFAAILLAVSSLHIYYSQEARSYALFVFMTLVSFYLYIIYKESKKRAIWLVTSNVLLLYTHVIAAFVILVQNLHFIIPQLNKKRKELREWVIMQTIIIAMYLPWLYFFTKKIPDGKYIFAWLSKPHLHSILDTLNALAGNSTLLILSTLLIGTYLWTGIIDEKNRERQFSNLILLLLWLLLPIIIVFEYSSIVTSIFLTRYFLFAAPALYLLIALTLSKIEQYKYAILCFIIILSASVVHTNQVSLLKDPWQSTVHELRKVVTENDTIILAPPHLAYPFTYYYLADCFTSKDIYTCTKEHNIITIWNKDELGSLDLNQTTWLITQYHRSFDEDEIYNHLREIKNSTIFVSNTTGMTSGIIVYKFE